MSGTEPTFCRSNTLHTFNVRSVNEAPKHLRSKSTARSTFPDLIVPSRYKVFARLKERWDPIKKEKTIKQRLHLATLAGVVNLRRMELKTIPDDIFYLEMDDKKKTKVKKEEEFMLLQQEKRKSQVETGVESSSVTTLKLEKSTELVIKEHNTSLENNQTKDNDDDDDDKDFQDFLENYSIEHGNVYSYGDVVKAYLKQRVANFIQKTLANRVPLIKHDKEKTSDTTQELKLLQNTPTQLSVQIPRETTAHCELMCTQATSGLIKEIVEKIHVEYGSQSLIAVPLQAKTGEIIKVPIRQPTLKHIRTKTFIYKQVESGVKPKDTEKSQIQYKSHPVTTGSTHFKTGTVRKVPTIISRQRTEPTEMLEHKYDESRFKTLRKCRTITTAFAQIGTRTGSKIPINTSQKSAIWTPREKSAEFPISTLPTIPKDRSVSTGSEGESPDTEKKVKGNDSPTNLSVHSWEYCFFRGNSLFGVNPFSGEEFCVLKDIRDTEEIKNRVMLLLHYLHSKSRADKEIQETHVRRTIKDMPQAVSKSHFGSTQVTQSSSLESDISASLIKSLSNDPEMYDDFERIPEKYMFFQGESLMCLNPLTGDTFCIFNNLGDINEIKNKIEKLLLSCLSPSTKAIPSSQFVKEYSDTNVPPYARQSPKNVSKIPVRKLTECSRAMFIKLPTRTAKQLKHTTKVTNTDFWSTLTVSARKTIYGASKDVSHSITSKIPSPVTSMSAARATVKQSSSIAPVKQTVSLASKVLLQSKIPRSIREMSSAKTRDDQSNTIRKRISSIDTINMVVSEPALELTMDEVWTQKYTENEDNDTDTLYEKADIGYPLIREMSNFGISMEPQGLPIPKYESEDGIPLQQGDSCVSLLGVIRKTPVTPPHNKGSQIPTSVAKVIKSPVTSEKKSKSFTDGTKQLCRKPQQNISSDTYAASTTPRQQSKTSTASMYNVTRYPTNTTKKSQEKIRPSSVSHGSETTYKQSGKSIKLVKGSPVSWKGKNVKEMSRKHGNEKQSHVERMHSVGVAREISQRTGHVEIGKKRKNIDVLILEYNKITEMPWKIGYLTNLTAIYLQNNMLQGIPSEIDKLQMLQKLQLDNNKITHLPVGLYNLKSLIILSLKGNKLIHVSSLICALESLECLDLSHNYLTIVPNGLDKLYNLKQLQVSRNNIKTVPQSFPPNLQELYANENEIESLPDLTNLIKLKVLSVKANRLTELPCLPPSIEKIYASRNSIYYLDESLIENWSKLETLNLARNQLFRLPENIDKLTSLRKLRISNNEIHSLPRALGKIYGLIELNTSMNPISGIPYHLMKGRDMYNLLKYIRLGSRRFQVEYSEDEYEGDEEAEKEGQQEATGFGWESSNEEGW